MALHYTEFDSTPQTIFADLRTAILASSDWSRLTSDTAIVTLGSNSNAGALTLNVATTTGFAVGQTLSIGTGSTREYRSITAVTPSQLSVTPALLYAHTAGEPIARGANVYKATTTRGADMIVDLSDAVSFQGLSMAVYESHNGTTGTGRRAKFLQWRYSATGAESDVLHVTLSLGKEHFFLMVEGPRGGEMGAVHALYGSWRDVVFLSDVVPYDEEDANPVVFAGGQNGFATTGASVVNTSHIGHLSRNLADTQSWSPARLASLQFLSAGEDEVANVQRQRELDGRYILTPYVVFDDATGMRGRLSSFFFAGFNQGTDHLVAPPALGSKVQYQGLWYKMLAVNKGDGNRAIWGPLGAVQNETLTSFARSVVVGVPCPP